MTSLRLSWGSVLLVATILLVVFPGKAAAFGAGNIPSIAQVEGHNWRHGDIEDVLKTLAFLHGKKWTTMMVSRTYFGNWLRDYSQAIDVGSLKGVNAATIRILIWVLSFMAHGYATEEFEVTEERLGVYRPEEHIDNPLGYADGEDARKYDPRLRGPVSPREVEVDPRTGMKNYIANETGEWATSAGYLRFSFARCIHFGRVYTNGSSGMSGKEADLCEALRCLGQALHCMEDFSAHSNYCELALRELGHHQVFAHCGSAAQVHVQGKTIYPIVTGTFGGVDFLHSVLGEANDHFTQSEVDEVEVALKNAEQGSRSLGPTTTRERGLFGLSLGGGSGNRDFISLVGQLPSIGDDFASQARGLQAASRAQEQENLSRDNTNVVPGMSPSFDPVKVAKQIYPILQFRDRIVKAINRVIAKIPGLESLIEHISETLTAFVLGLLAPFVRPIITQVSKALKEGSSGVINSSAQSQYEPWNDPHCSNPTHSMLSKDHFTNILNPCAGRVAATVLQYVVPRVLYAWENPGVPVDEVVNDVLRAFHHPALRDDHVEIQREMFNTVRLWAQESPYGHQLDHLLSSESVKAGKNHILKDGSDSRGHAGHSHGTFGGIQETLGQLGHGKVAGSLWSQVQTRDLAAMEGRDGNPSTSYISASPAPPTAPPYGATSSSAYDTSHGQGNAGAAASYYASAPSEYKPPSSAPSTQPPPGGYSTQQYPPQGPSYGGPSHRPAQAEYGGPHGPHHAPLGGGYPGQHPPPGPPGPLGPNSSYPGGHWAPGQPHHQHPQHHGQGHGGPGYGQQPYPPQYPPHHQQWEQYPGQHRRY